MGVPPSHSVLPLHHGSIAGRWSSKHTPCTFSFMFSPASFAMFRLPLVYDTPSSPALLHVHLPELLTLLSPQGIASLSIIYFKCFTQYLIGRRYDTGVCLQTTTMSLFLRKNSGPIPYASLDPRSTGQHVRGAQSKSEQENGVHAQKILEPLSLILHHVISQK